MHFDWSKSEAMYFDCVRVVRINSICASYKIIVFLSVKTENNNFIKEIKHVVRVFYPGKNLGKVCENSLEQMKTLDCVSGFR